MIEIQSAFNPAYEVDVELLERAILFTLESQEKPEMDITLRLTGDDEIQTLNEAYRGISKATDVLSFVEDYLDPETGRMYLGDIVVSVETASRQAAEANHTLDVECTLLAIHGTLHLLGFDHAEPDEHDQMWKLQGEILQQAIEKYSGSSK